MIESIVKKLQVIPKWTKLGVLGVVFMYVSLAGVTSAALPWWIGKGDSALHIDYALSIYHGEIPHYRDFVKYPIFHQLDKGYKTQLQRAAANPPLFYILHAPIVGPLLDAGRWKPAVALGRTLNMTFGVLVVMSLAWAGWLWGGKRKELFAVAVPAIGTLSYQFTNLNQNYALDALLIFLAILTMITWHKLLTHGFERRYVVSIFVLSILGMATKATYIVFFGLSLLTIMATALIHTKGNRLKRLWQGSLISGVLSICLLLTIGWFYYYWNYKTSGKWYTGELPGDFGSRPYKSLRTVLTSQGLWSNFYARFTSNPKISEWMTYTATAGVILSAFRMKFRGMIQDKSQLLSLILLLLVLVGTTGTQITHAWGIGNFSFRYFLPAILVYSLFMAWGLLEIKWVRGQLITLVLLCMAGSSLVTIANLDNIERWVPAVGGTDSIYQKLHLAFAYNGLPDALLVLMFVLLFTGLPLTAVALFKLSGPVKSRSAQKV